MSLSRDSCVAYPSWHSKLQARYESDEIPAGAILGEALRLQEKLLLEMLLMLFRFFLETLAFALGTTNGFDQLEIQERVLWRNQRGSSAPHHVREMPNLSAEAVPFAGVDSLLLSFVPEYGTVPI